MANNQANRAANQGQANRAANQDLQLAQQQHEDERRSRKSFSNVLFNFYLIIYLILEKS